MSFSAFRVIAIIVISNIVCYYNGFAQSKLDSIQVLQEVIITKQQIPKEIIPVQSLSGKELEKLSAHSVADALRYFSGVQIKDYGGIGGLKTINIRSLGSEHVGVFYDGIEIGNAQNGVVDLGRFSLDNMEIISLYNGQKSAIFQPAKDFASASSIYMTAKAPSFKKDKNYNIKATFKTGAFDLVNPSLLWEQKLLNKISSSFSGDYTYSSGKYKFREKVKNSYDTTMIRKNGDINIVRLEHSLNGKIKEGEWKTKAYFYNSKRGYPGAVVKEEPGRFTNEDRQWDTNLFFQSSIKKRLSKKYTTELRGKYAYDYIHYISDPEKDERVTLPVDNEYKLHEVYFSSANMFNILPFWNLNVSADYQWNKLNANLKNFAYPKRHVAWGAVATSLYFDRVKLQASMLGTFAREEYIQGIYIQNPNNPDKSEYIGDEKISKNWNKYTPTIIVSYQPWQQSEFHLRAFYKKIFRLPTFSEIYYTIIGSGMSHLRPEYTTQYNIGATYSKNFNQSLFSHFDMQLDVYYNKVKDKLLAIPGGQAFRWTMMNIGKVKIKGMETTAVTEMQWIKGLKTNIRLTYTYQEALDYTDPELDPNGEHDISYKGQITYIPRHSSSAIIGTNYKTWDLTYSFIYTGERYKSSANTLDNYAPAWYTSDLALTKSLEWYKKNVRLTAEVNNIFNQQYEVVPRYPMPGMNFKLIISVTL